jgi:hypothetical protein
MAETVPARWTLNGTILIACNCDYGCPCNFNALPTKGFCEGQWTWRVSSGAVDDVALDGLAFSIAVKWPGAIHEGNGEGVILVDERATPEQRAAIASLVGGKYGGPWAVLAWTWPKVHGPKAVPYEFTGDGIGLQLAAGDAMRIESAHIKNPVTGADVHPGMVLPEGIVVKRADLGTTSVFRVNEGISFDHSGKYSAVGRFEYAWP